MDTNQPQILHIPNTTMDFPWKKGLGRAFLLLGGQVGEPLFGFFFSNGVRTSPHSPVEPIRPKPSTTGIKFKKRRNAEK